LRKRLGCQYLIDDDEIPIGRVVRFGKGAAGEERCAHGFEIPWEYGERIGGLIPAPVHDRGLLAPRDRSVAAIEWNQGRRGDLLDVAYLAQRGLDFADAGRTRLGR